MGIFVIEDVKVSKLHRIIIDIQPPQEKLAEAFAIFFCSFWPLDFVIYKLQKLCFTEI